MSHKVTAPAALVKIGDSTSSLFYQGAVLPDTADPDDLARLEALGYVEAIVETIVEESLEEASEEAVETAPVVKGRGKKAAPSADE